MCKMASVAETLDVSLARLVREDLELIFEEELTFRKSLCDRVFFFKLYSKIKLKLYFVACCL